MILGPNDPRAIIRGRAGHGGKRVARMPRPPVAPVDRRTMPGAWMPLAPPARRRGNLPTLDDIERRMT